MCGWVHEGTGWPLKHVTEFKGGPAVVYGTLRGCLAIMHHAEHFHYIDHGYLRRDEHYRVVQNRHAHEGVPDPVSGARFASLNLQIKPWREGGQVYLICPPSIHVQRVFGCYDWLEKAQKRWHPHRIRTKESPVSLQDDLRDVRAVVTFNSNVGVDALLEGVPVIADHGPCVGVQDRRRLFEGLAWCQWTVDEIRQGLPWNYPEEMQRDLSGVCGL